MVNVTKENFIEQSNDLLRHLPSAAFVAIDEEMTGITVSRGRRPPKDQCPLERYAELKQAPERYSIIQLGVALFHHPASSSNNNNNSPNRTNGNNSTSGRGYASVPAGSVAVNGVGVGAPDLGRQQQQQQRYQVRRYNFYMFPDDKAEREVVLNPNTVAFLNQHNMSFDMWSKQGIPFATSTGQATALLQAYTAAELQDRNPLSSSSADNDNNEAGNSSNKPTVQSTIRRRVELRRTDDVEFFARAMAGLREWLDSDAGRRNGDGEIVNEREDNGGDDDDDEEEEGAIASEGLSYLMPPCNSFLRRALYESIQAEYPSLETEPGGNSQIRVWRLNEEERQARIKRLRRERWAELIGKKLGLWRVFEALHRACSGLELDRTSVLFADSYDQVDWDSISADSAAAAVAPSPTQQMVPLIVHNGFMDICFLLSHFHSSILPENYQECKDLISSYWPIIYDTKVISTECNCWGNGSAEQSPYTNLANLFRTVVRDAPPPPGQRLLQLDDLELVESRSSLRQGSAPIPDQEHEAAYDAYMTGACFLGLLMMIRQIATVSPNFLDIVANLNSSEARMFYGRNKLYQMSMYTMDLEESRPNRDPMSRGMLPETTYRVAGIDKAVSTRDIVACLSGLTDTQDRQVNFEIVWIDDTTFLVAASFRNQSTIGDEMETVLRDHGQIIFRALRDRFSNGESIVLLESYLQTMEDARPGGTLATKENWLSRALAFFGLKGKKRAASDHADSAQEQANKRQRVS